MKMKKQKAAKAMDKSGLWFSLGVVTLAAGRLAAEQPVIYHGPLTPVTPVSVREQQEQSQTNSPNVFIPASEARRSDVPQIFRSGPLSFRPHVGYQFLYGTGIQSTPTISGETAIHTISPGFLLEYGTHWALDYTPTITLYSNNQFHDTLGHAVTLRGGTSYEDWQFGLEQTYGNSEQVLAETGGQSVQTSFGTTLSASRILNDKMSADFGFAQKIQDTDGFQGTRDWSLSSWLNYQFWQRLTVSGGAILGYVNVDFGDDQTYQDVQARAHWRISDKMGLAVNAGGEAREFASSGTIFSPVFGATFQYQPRERTQLSVGASRTVAPSLFVGQVSETTSFNANIYQHLFKKFDLGIGASYGVADYTLANGNSSRRDDSYSFSARLSHPLFKRGTLSAIYQFSDNRSTQSQYTFRSNQFGAEFNYTF